MPISLLQPLHIGNAVRVFIAPPAGTVRLKVLRKTVNAFIDHGDIAAFVIEDGVERVVLDTDALVNGVIHYYALFVFDGTTWVADGVAAVTPAASFAQLGTDVLAFVRDRLDLGLKVIVDRGVVHHQNGHIQVLTAPPLFDEAMWPLVTVHLQQDASGERAIGEEFSGDTFDGGEWTSYEGWLSRVNLMIVGWCLNPDERIALRKAIKDVLIANLAVFDTAGMLQIDVSQSDTEDFQSYNAPVYQATTTLTCLAPSYVAAFDNAIIDVSVTMTP